ncbi:MAG: OmpA family protein [Sulfitobacter sp.]
MIRVCATFLALLLCGPVLALDLKLPRTARLTVERNTDPDIYSAPVEVFSAGQVPSVSVEGPVRRAAWRLDSPGLTPLQVMRPLRTQLEEAGLELVLDCPAKTCGGFDFRFAIETLPGPNMYVNIRAYQFVTALRRVDGETKEVVTVLASTSATSAYVQIVQAGEIGTGEVKVATVAQVPLSTTDAVQGDLVTRLLATGHVVLDRLDCETGASDLGQGTFASIETLAGFFKARPTLRIALVGHTDSIGGLDGNIALSKRRAQSVRQRLIEVYGLDGDRLDAQGMGYLSPVASNLEEAGREANRRVEVILLGE